MTVDRLFAVDEEIVFITGGAGQLGSEYSAAFLERAAKVVGYDIRSSPRSTELEKRFPERYLFLTGDVTRRPDLENALRAAEARFGVPTVLINNAAIDSPPSAPVEENGPFEDYPEESWDRVVAVNLKGVHLCCQVIGGEMARRGVGSIINIVSIYGVVAPDQRLYEYRRRRGETFYKPVAYSASKSGLLNLTRYLSVYWAERGVRVNSLTIAGVYNGQEQEFLDAYCGRIPIGRMADPRDYNGAVLFLASRASEYMTGSNLIVDGGWTAI